ncbi:hypothetical protein PHYBOEH_003549 [Phytophthora boehmeriae]|uniref:Uncharacterized protein n=1 Tax=Phytophthora boehmeriae TaxID=109152 RepID=A0A8T1XG42_9STRA|nr:hypothetical protein PHYBOEH_003549 [Phytophthora boehmeriae]
MTVLLLTRLRDVEHQLWQASTAVKLHLKLLGASSGDRNDVAVAVEQVQTLVTSIEQVQHELQSSTTEILSLARKMTIRDGNDIEEVADGEETETEDEDEEEENFQPKQEPEEPSEVPEQVEQSAEEGETLTLGGAFEFLKTLQVEPEAVDLSRDIDEEQETVAQQVEQELGVMTVEDGRSDTKHVDDEEIRDIHEAQATGDEEREVVTVEKTSDIHSLNYVNAESIQQNHDGGENVFMETEPVVIKNNEDEEEEGEVLAVEEKAVTSETNTISSTELRAQIAAIRRSAMSMTIDYERRLQAGNCSVEDATAFSRDITTMTSVVTRYRSKYCRRLWIEQIVGMLTWILEGVKKPELLQALEPARDSCVQLQQYCKAQYPNYLQDLLYDVTTVKALEQENALDSSNLGSFLQLFVDQLRFDCLEHSSKVTMTGIDLRSEEQWGNVNTICEQLIALINQADGQHITVESARETILVLREFDKRFPTRIPAELLG